MKGKDDLVKESINRLKVILYDASDKFSERRMGPQIRLNKYDIKKILDIIVEMGDRVEERVMKEVEERMVNGDAFTAPIEFTLQKAMKEFEGSDDKNDKIIYEGLRRSMTVWENIKIHNLQIFGMTYDQFCKQCETKTNIVFLTDDEMQNINKAMRIMKVIEEE